MKIHSRPLSAGAGTRAAGRTPRRAFQPFENSGRKYVCRFSIRPTQLGGIPAAVSKPAIRLSTTGRRASIATIAAGTNASTVVVSRRVT